MREPALYFLSHAPKILPSRLAGGFQGIVHGELPGSAIFSETEATNSVGTRLLFVSGGTVASAGSTERGILVVACLARAEFH